MWNFCSKHARAYFRDNVRPSNFRIAAVMIIGLSVLVGLALAYVVPAHAICTKCPTR